MLESVEARACTDALKQRERLESLERYAGAGHGTVEIDNNLAKNAIRGVALWRDNWPQAGSKSA